MQIYKKNLSRHFEDKLQKGDNKGFWQIWNAEFKKQSLPTNRIEGETKNADICNEFGAAFSNAFINSGDNNLLQNEYEQKFKEYASKNDNRVKLLTLDDILSMLSIS